MKARINIITLGVKDLEKSIHFYELGLGLPRMPFEGNVAFFELSGSWLSLYPWSALAEDAEVNATGEGFRGVTLAHNVASKSEVDEVMAQAEKAGAIIQKPAQDVFWGGYSGDFSDPDGQRLWHGKVAIEKADEYEKFMISRAAPDYGSVDGLFKLYFQRRNKNTIAHFLLVTIWDSMESVKKFAGEYPDKAKYYPEDGTFLLEKEETLALYEIFFEK